MNTQHASHHLASSTEFTVPDSRSTLREERHPNAVTAPPVNRGSMVPVPWRGFWNSIGTAVLMTLTNNAGHSGGEEADTHAIPAKRPAAWERAARRRRMVFLLITLLTTAIATTLFAGVQPQYDNAWLEYAQLGLFALLSAWVVTGFTTALMGL